MATEEETAAWRLLMEGLVVGGLRGMADAHTALGEKVEIDLPPLNETALYQAAIVMAATLLETAPDCADPAKFEAASQVVAGDMLQHLRALRLQRVKLGGPTLERIYDQAGLERHKRH